MSKKNNKQKAGFFDDDPAPKRKTKITLLIDPVKVAQLIRASELPIKEKPKDINLNYPTYSQEQVQRWVREYLDSKPEDDSSSSGL